MLLSYLVFVLNKPHCMESFPTVLFCCWSYCWPVSLTAHWTWDYVGLKTYINRNMKLLRGWLPGLLKVELLYLCPAPICFVIRVLSAVTFVNHLSSDPFLLKTCVFTLSPYLLLLTIKGDQAAPSALAWEVALAHRYVITLAKEPVYCSHRTLKCKHSSARFLPLYNQDHLAPSSSVTFVVSIWVVISVAFTFHVSFTILFMTIHTFSRT